ncbi:amino acid ABC transporter substrate-binding protein (PAAT family) [Breoghania corrubedonensis]|uniref:Amino acid ABC transporter substrate-binding protein (PAAT family) n=1 Tax=Breoghania corrubedonensis TaxID=665038 RepID=A0A2T5VB30_9HYPH|nr:transporter substrate-binding domain-containing protein [Breoghania corrubedonensis]PTW60960.1 amino acid ABC transporter substrate-binding protein (PAAT family) [Breoghania corrubedonensis]
MRAFILAMLVIASALVPDTASAEDVPGHNHLHFASGHNPPLSNDEHTGFNDRILAEAFRRTGIEISLRRVPTGRAGPLVNAGTEDGCGPRIPEFSEYFPNLVPIKEPAITFEFVAFTRRDGIRFNGWESLSRYTVGHLMGSVILARNSDKHAAAVTRVKSVIQLFELLDRGRIDIAIIERWTGLDAIKRLGLKNVRMLHPALARRPMFFFLNRKHAALVPRVEAAMREMKADGTYDRTMVQVLNPLLVGF